MGSYGPPTRNTCITTTHLPVRSYVSGMTIAPVTYCTMRSRKYTEGTGSPDGMTIDCNDNLWVAQWGGGGVYCYNPYTGDLLTKIVVPAPT